MKKPYNLDWETNTLTMTKKFAAEASRYGSQAYNILMDARMNGFRVSIIKEKPRKACPTRVTFKQMETVLTCMDNADERLDQLHTVMDMGKGQKNQYEYVRKWFLANYPNYRDIPTFDDKNNIIGPRVSHQPNPIVELEKTA